MLGGLDHDQDPWKLMTQNGEVPLSLPRLDLFFFMYHRTSSYWYFMTSRLFDFILMTSRLLDIIFMTAQLLDFIHDLVYFLKMR